MFVVEAVVLTFMTTPFTLLIYPEKYRVRASADLDKRGTRDVEKSGAAAGGIRFAVGAGGRETTTKLLVVLQKIEHLSAVMLLAQMLEPPAGKPRSPWSGSSMKKSGSKGSSTLEGDISEESTESSPNPGVVALPNSELVHTSASARSSNSSAIRIDALKLIELTGRTFSVMQSAEKDQLLLTDDTLQLFRQFGRLRGLEITPHISIVGQDSFPNAVADYAEGLGTELTLVPWTIPVIGGSAPTSIEPSLPLGEKDAMLASSSTLSPFERMFGGDATGSPMYTHFLRRVFTECPTDTALFIDRGFASTTTFPPGAGQHIFMPFYGGPDDRLALRFVLQLCHHTNVTATIVRILKPEAADDEEEESDEGGRNSTGNRLSMSESMQVHQAALNSNQLTIGPSAQVSIPPFVLRRDNP